MHLSLQYIVGIWFFVEWLFRISAFYLVPRGRKPSSSTAWLMLIMLQPTLGIVAFWLIGNPKLPQKRRAMQRTMDEVTISAINSIAQDATHHHVIAEKVSPHLQPFVDLNRSLGRLPAFYGNQAEMLSDYDAMMARIIEDIDHAERFVHLEFFIVALDATTEPLFKAMARAVKRGVKVRVLYDAFGSRRYPRFQEMKRTLNNIGVQWHAMLPFRLPGSKHYTRLDLRNHRKIAVFDGITAYTGSLNLIERTYHRRDNLYYDELMVRVTGPIVFQLECIFKTDWYAETGGLLSHEIAPETKVMLDETGPVMAQVLPSGPGHDNDNNLKLFTALIHAAKHKVVVVNPYFVPDDSLMIAITSAAQRGVDVTLINSEIMDQKLVGYAQRSYYEELLQAGVKIYWYQWPILLHAKTMTIDDDIAVVGSSNLDIRSFTLDHEITMVLYDESAVTDLRKIEAQYIERSQLVHLSEWQTRPWRSKLWDNLARLTSSVQ